MRTWGAATAGIGGGDELKMNLNRVLEERLGVDGAAASESDLVGELDVYVAGDLEWHLVLENHTPPDKDHMVDIAHSIGQVMDQGLVLNLNLELGFPEEGMRMLLDIALELKCSLEGDLRLKYDIPAMSDVGLLDLVQDYTGLAMESDRPKRE
ncbi:uncharacterized protein Z519_10348 [Cladophialophora bantiana CBS 173.52]|uniref:Uncharacterized protein n=1 Tax=Cladophialophora bantiana (strain ATCC 10958 / CBS 173.52 / CDC B-1940 / NIH 8579) TaxID=1442370 RepID=A0A0D2HWC0_CLAB1|nr:uncharacterized protein Z519_10348 [Cladophialophora bantiana CBS 173.52]KIW88864.1 hypothetical protein Z519_10348 [Cladophialophora bantiana CBS 173.52]